MAEPKPKRWQLPGVVTVVTPEEMEKTAETLKKIGSRSPRLKSVAALLVYFSREAKPHV